MQKFLNTELGRSLVEMLGVLAIIGVLSIASIAGYSYAVTKWKALDTLDEVATRAIEYDRQLALIRDWKPGDEFDNYDLGDTTSLGYGISGFVSEEDNYFEIEVTGVPIEVCRQLARELDDVTYGPIVSMTVGEADFGTEIECVENARVAFLIGPDWETYASNNEATARTSTMPMTQTRIILTTTRTPVTTTPGSPCTDNGDCTGEGFCNLYFDSSYLNTCHVPTSGYCREVGFTEGTVMAKRYFLSHEEMNFWSAHNFCATFGGTMVSLSDLDCPDIICHENNTEKYQKLVSFFGNVNVVWVNDNIPSWGTCPIAYHQLGSHTTGGNGHGYGNTDYRALCIKPGTWPDDLDVVTWNPPAVSSTPESTTPTTTTTTTMTQTGSHYTQTITPFVSSPCDEDEIYYEGECVPSCAKNEDCTGENEYCWLDSSTNNYSCTEKPTKGVCKPAAVSHTKTINDKTYKRSSDPMNFWSAENFCARIGGKRVKVSDFECGYDFVTNKTYGYCNKDTSTSYSGTRSDTMKEFLSGLGSDWVWTDDDYSACSAYRVGLFDGGYVRDNNRYSNFDALCRVDGS